MREIENRLTRCPSCKDTFTYRYQTTGGQEDNLIIKMSCPFCKTRLKVDLNPYTRTMVTSYKALNGNNSEESQTIALELPLELPATVEE